MSWVKGFIERWRKDFDYKTVIAALGSISATALFALYNGFLGFLHKSLWYGTICIYYIILIALRALIVFAQKRISLAKDIERAGKRAYVEISFLLLILNGSLVLPISIMVKQQKPVHMTLVPAIIMAGYTTYKVTMASINFKRKNRSKDSLVRLLRTIGFNDALVSILSLQNALIMVKNKDNNNDMLPLTALVSAIVLITIVVLSIKVLIEGIASLRSKGTNE